MSKVFQIVEDLKTCYTTKAPFVEDYVKLNNKEREDLCADVRKSLINYVNSSEYNFSDIVKSLNQFASSNIYLC